MGKVTGFMEIDRQVAKYQPASDRIRHFREFTIPMSDAEVQKQADAAGEIDWVVSIDSTIARVHQHGATLARDTGGCAESQESVVRAA